MAEQVLVLEHVFAGYGETVVLEIFPSLTLRENLEVAARPGTWTMKAVFELFPRLAERIENRGNQLSGDEQQMLAAR